jgi:ribosomal protein RSM22 (predicted rRNA methylase)
VQLPEALRKFIEEQAAAAGLSEVRRAARAMSDAYRQGHPSRVDSAADVAAYLATRMPATYAAADSVWREVGSRVEGRTLLDVGAGTGSGSLAALRHVSLDAITLIERDRRMAEAAAQLLPSAEVRIEDFTRASSLPRFDFVIAAYSLGEAGSPDLASRLWEAARVALIVIEPGTPRGFAFIRRLRDLVLQAGAHIIAPCPGACACPIADPDWCHFGARVERSALHRRLKEAELSYEDEKFSYVAFGRQPVAEPAARILRRPQHRPGLIVLETCTTHGTETVRVTKRDAGRFRSARRAGWGDPWGSV